MPKILIVEDDPVVRESIVEIIEGSEFEYLQAENGKSALHIIDEELPDLIVSDVMMPEMNGIDLLKSVKSNPSTSMIPFIFLTAKVEYSDLRNGMSLGADDYIFKPFKAKDLTESINLRLDKKKQFNDKLSEIALNLTKYIPHELRTPLFPIIGFSDFLVSDFNNLKPSDLVEIFNKINKSGKRLHKTIEKFLLYTEFELLKFDLHTTQILREKFTDNIDTLINDIVFKKSSEFNRMQDVELKLSAADIKISEEHSIFLISEILENAFKFSENGTNIIITTEIVDKFYSIKIKDFGIGMSNEQLQNSGPFIQHDRQIHNQDGIGLGLAIIKSIIDLYNGIIKIQSKYNCFTEFEIKLPLK